jgi:predicted HNH restriction endonuclease
MNENVYSDEEIINELQRLDKKFNRVTIEVINKHGKMSKGTVIHRFGSWSEGKKEANVDVYERKKVPENGISGEKYYKYILNEVSCIECSKDEPSVIQFHHPNDDKKGNVGCLGANSYSSEKVYNELRKTVPICANCHAKHHSPLSSFKCNKEPPEYIHPKNVETEAMAATISEKI